MLAGLRLKNPEKSNINILLESVGAKVTEVKNVVFPVVGVVEYAIAVLVDVLVVYVTRDCCIILPEVAFIAFIVAIISSYGVTSVIINEYDITPPYVFPEFVLFT